ncbi:hypothetical protein [Zavarzinella formosa]|uniref:hypothetical protein n=1 Tax=Zavarzinella formosa TaxID=360055 RepID=UPI00031B28D9|nr:hypothetical protein [Zavarzinella formosa]
MSARRCLLAALLAILMAGCRQPDPSMELPGYELVIPDDVPLHYVFQDKDRQRYDRNGHEDYAGTHRQGWSDCWMRYQKGKLDPADETAEPIAMSEPALPERGRRDGFQACRRWLLMERRKHDGPNTLPER